MSGEIERYSVERGDLWPAVEGTDGLLEPAFVVLAADYDTAIAERDRARDIAARLEGEIARVREAISAPGMHEDSCCSKGCRGMHSIDWASAANALQMVGLDVGPMPDPRCDESCNCLAREFIDALTTPLNDEGDLSDAVIAEGES